MKQIPLCHKCVNAITQYSEVFKHYTVVGCKECAQIKDYQDAKELCPLLRKPQCTQS
jgi:hypothetical protein